MNSEAVAIKLALSIREAIEGVTYYPRGGAKCPWCGERLRVLDTKSWVGSTRIRYQRCVNERCPLCVMDQNVKSIESDTAFN